MTKQRVELPETPVSKEALIENLEGQYQAAELLERELRTSLKQCGEHKTSIRSAIREIRNGGRRRPPRRTADLDPRKQAGEKNIERVRMAIGKLGVATQAVLARESGVGTGSMTWAVRALEAEGIIEPTGEIGPRGSREFRLIEGGKGRRKMAAGT